MRTWQLRAVTAVHRVAFDVTRGRLGGRMVGMPVYKVTTIGRRSGEPRDTMLTAPIVEGDRVVLVASYGGSPTHPQWYRNMLANPRITLTGGGRTRDIVIRTATEAEHAELWPRVTAAYDGYAAYQAKTDRTIPLVICE